MTGQRIVHSARWYDGTPKVSGTSFCFFLGDSNFLSHPVVSGFTSAAALIIGASQLKHLFGFDIPSGSSVLETVYDLTQGISQTHVPTFVVGSGAIAIIVGLKRFRPKWPGALIAVLIGIGCSYLLDFTALGVSTLGDVPGGLPMPAVPEDLSLQARGVAGHGKRRLARDAWQWPHLLRRGRRRQRGLAAPGRR